MRQVVKLLLVTVVLSLLPTGSLAQKSVRRTRKASAPIICEIASVSKGMVVVGHKRNSACRNGTELLVKRPENGDIICADSPLPTQFSIVADAQGRSAGTCSAGAYLIAGSSPSASAERRRAAGSASDETIARAFATRASGTQVEGEGAVIRLLPDDLNGSRHQRFIIQLASGQTLLISHNIDVAARIDGLEVGDSVRFSGEYEWNEKGGVVHWTHRDPRGRHVGGWLTHNGKTYQ